MHNEVLIVEAIAQRRAYESGFAFAKTVNLYELHSTENATVDRNILDDQNINQIAKCNFFSSVFSFERTLLPPLFKFEPALEEALTVEVR